MAIKDNTRFKGTPKLTDRITVSVNGKDKRIPLLDLYNTKPYKVYIATLSQASTNAPTATVLENTFTNPLTWTRSSQGSYRLTSLGEFTANKTFMMTGQYPDLKVNIQRVNTSILTITSSDTSGGVEFPDDGYLTESAIEIRVYN